MKDLLLYIARNLVDHPEAVTVTEVPGQEEITLELRVAPEDMGKVIGRQGRIAKEIRTVVRSYAQRTGTKVSVDIVDLIEKEAVWHLPSRFLFYLRKHILFFIFANINKLSPKNFYKCRPAFLLYLSI